MIVKSIYESLGNKPNEIVDTIDQFGEKLLKINKLPYINEIHDMVNEVVPNIISETVECYNENNEKKKENVLRATDRNGIQNNNIEKMCEELMEISDENTWIPINMKFGKFEVKSITLKDLIEMEEY